MKQPASADLTNFKLTAQALTQHWLDNDALILDTETTGLEWGSEIVEICIIEARTGKVLLDTLVYSLLSIPQETIDIHGITNEMVEDSPMFFEIAEAITSILNGRTVIAYNAAFDKKMLNSSAAKFGGIINLECDLQCAQLAYAKFKGDWNHGFGEFKWHSLVNAAKQQGITLEGTAHRALYDCQLTREL
ncbi:MAG: 3'-5' exonuclease, partial [Shewanella sp.]